MQKPGIKGKAKEKTSHCWRDDGVERVSLLLQTPSPVRSAQAYTWLPECARTRARARTRR